jgi:Uma2 family endonuclease
MLIALEKIYVPQGQRVLLENISWQEFENILEELGENRSARIAYDQGTLEIMTPLPEHEFNKEIISDLIKALLEELEINFLSLGSTTFKNIKMYQGIEPDNCFYIANESKIREKKRLDLTIDPPPDLALEIDLTSRTHQHIYAALGITELWRFEKGNLLIYLLQDGQYIEAEKSLNFPNLRIKEVIPDYLQQVNRIGRNQVMKVFRQWVRKEIAIISRTSD